MAKRFIDLYNEAQQKKQAGAQKASLPAAPTQKKTQTTRKASLSQLSMPGSIGQTYRDELPKLEMPKLKTAQTTAPQIKKSYAPKADGLPDIRALGAGDYTGSAKLMEKAAQTVKAGVLGAASGIAEIAGQATPTTGDQHLGQFSGLGDLGRAVRESRRETGADIGKSIQRMEQARSARRKESQRKTYDAATTLSEKSAALQEKAKQGAGKVGGFLVDLGVTGTQVAGDTLVVERLEDLDTVDFSRPVYLLSQTTQSLELFDRMKEEILRRAADPAKITVHDTICRQVSNRNPHLQEFVRRFDVVIFVCGRKSSNGKVLYQTCLAHNPRSYTVEDETELQPAWFDNCRSVGICGATSTPKWLMQRVAENIARLTGSLTE